MYQMLKNRRKRCDIKELYLTVWVRCLDGELSIFILIIFFKQKREGNDHVARKMKPFT